MDLNTWLNDYQSWDGGQLRQTLLAFVVISTVVEVALAPIFNWRVYLARFAGDSYIHPLTFVVTYALLSGYHIELIGALLQGVRMPSEMLGVDQFLSALLVMGGSQGVFRILNAFGIQDAAARQRKAAEIRAVATKLEEN